MRLIRVVEHDFLTGDEMFMVNPRTDRGGVEIYPLHMNGLEVPVLYHKGKVMGSRDGVNGKEHQARGGGD